MNTSKDWTAVALRQPANSDFVSREWAIEVWCDGPKIAGFVYNLQTWLTNWQDTATHWRKVRLCPPPLRSTTSEDIRAWQTWVQCNLSADETHWDCFMAGRRTMRQEIAEIAKNFPRDTWDANHSMYAIEKSLVWRLLVSVGLDP